ncbi:MAG: hypothetical protein RQ899_10300 [Pseudomonadales bacterium]|nr:hypothetical protein [Pseudomonadales bacterium]
MEIISSLMVFISSNETALFALGIFSAVTFVFTLIAVPWLILRIPVDYFSSRQRRPAIWQDRHPLLRAVLLSLKNLLGGLLLFMGIVLLVLPGQGLLTMLVGIILLDFPGKYPLECWLIRQRPLLLSVNWIRHRRGREALLLGPAKSAKTP